MNRVMAFILAGGQGKRMGILCHKRPKPVLSFAGRYHVIDFSLSNCIHSGVQNIAVLADYQSKRLKEYLGDGTPWMSVPSENFHVLEAKANPYKGTADAIYQNLSHLHRSDASKVLVLAADHVYRMDYREMLLFHEQKKADVTVGVISVPITQAHRFGIVTSNANGRITDFIEKPHVPPGNLVSMGIYIFNKGFLIERLIEDAVLPASSHDFGHTIFPNLVKQYKVFAYEFKGYWQDIGSIEAYYEANMELIGERQPLCLDDRVPVLTNYRDLPPPELTSPDNVNHSLVSPGCVIKGKVINSILSPGVRIEEQAVVSNSIIMSETIVGRCSVVDRCILDENVSLGEFCYVGFGTGPDTLRGQLTILGENVTVPSYTAIGRNCRVLPDVEPTHFSAIFVPAGTTVSKQQCRISPVRTGEAELVEARG